MKNTPAQSAPPTPNARAVTRARELFIAANGAMGQRYACTLALASAAGAGCRWSPDQLKARAFGGVVFNGFGLAAPVDARPTIPAPAPAPTFDAQVAVSPEAIDDQLAAAENF